MRRARDVGGESTEEARYYIEPHSFIAPAADAVPNVAVLALLTQCVCVVLTVLRVHTHALDGGSARVTRVRALAQSLLLPFCVYTTGFFFSISISSFVCNAAESQTTFPPMLPRWSSARAPASRAPLIIRVWGSCEELIHRARLPHPSHARSCTPNELARSPRSCARRPGAPRRFCRRARARANEELTIK